MNDMDNSPVNLGNGLVMRPVRDLHDAQRYSALSGFINGQHEDEMCTQLLQHHPDTTYADYILVEDTNADRLVSTTCLIPWQINLCGVTLRTAMLEMVVTHPDYRRRGLVRSQIDYFHQRVNSLQFDLSIIQGIAYYYRQFGYAYALDHRPFDRLPTANIPLHNDASPYEVRIAILDDVPTLTALYKHSLNSRDLYVQRNDAFGNYLFNAPYYTTHIIDSTQDKTSHAYVILQPHPGKPDEVVEAVADNPEAALALLQFLRDRIPSEVRVPSTLPSQLIQTARTLGSQPITPYQWLLRVTHMPALLMKLASVFRQRLSASTRRDYTGEYLINLYRAAYRMRFLHGQLVAVDDVGFVDASMGADGGDLCIPPDAFVRLLFGYRSLESVRDAYPDIIWKDATIDLLAILFPVMSSCIWMPY